MGVNGGERTDEMTLAFSLAAIERLAEPGAAFEDARTWSRHVGIIDNAREPIDEIVDAHGLEQGYDLDEEDKWLAMERIRETTSTPRHVYLGVTDEDRRVATSLGWEFISISEAAEKAGWPLKNEETVDGILTRILSGLPF